MTGRVADGLILQLADPDLIRWFVGQVREAATAAGRDPARSRSRPRRPAYVGAARPRARADALVPGARLEPRRRPRQQVPARAAAGQPDRLHPGPRRATTTSTTPRSARRTPSFVGDEVTDRFCVLGTAEEHVAKLRELAAAGVDQFNLYLMNGDEEDQLEAYGRDVIPAFATSADVLAPSSGWSAGRRRRYFRSTALRRHDAVERPRDGAPGGPMIGRLRHGHDPWWDDGTAPEDAASSPHRRRHRVRPSRSAPAA